MVGHDVLPRVAREELLGGVEVGVEVAVGTNSHGVLRVEAFVIGGGVARAIGLAGNQSRTGTSVGAGGIVGVEELLVLVRMEQVEVMPTLVEDERAVGIGPDEDQLVSIAREGAHARGAVHHVEVDGIVAPGVEAGVRARHRLEGQLVRVIPRLNVVPLGDTREGENLGDVKAVAAAVAVQQLVGEHEFVGDVVEGIGRRVATGVRDQFHRDSPLQLGLRRQGEHQEDGEAEKIFHKLGVGGATFTAASPARAPCPCPSSSRSSPCRELPPGPDRVRSLSWRGRACRKW